MSTSFLCFYYHIDRFEPNVVSGGEAGPIQDMIDIFETKVISCREKLIRWDRYGVDESLRVDKSRTLIEIEKRNIYNI